MKFRKSSVNLFSLHSNIIYRLMCGCDQCRGPLSWTGEFWWYENHSINLQSAPSTFVVNWTIMSVFKMTFPSAFEILQLTLSVLYTCYTWQHPRAVRVDLQQYSESRCWSLPVDLFKKGLMFLKRFDIFKRLRYFEWGWCFESWRFQKVVCLEGWSFEKV